MLEEKIKDKTKVCFIRNLEEKHEFKKNNDDFVYNINLLLCMAGARINFIWRSSE